MAKYEIIVTAADVKRMIMHVKKPETKQNLENQYTDEFLSTLNNKELTKILIIVQNNIWI